MHIDLLQKQNCVRRQHELMGQIGTYCLIMLRTVNVSEKTVANFKIKIEFFYFPSEIAFVVQIWTRII